MSKKMKRGNMEMYSSHTIADDKARFKYDSLLQDYHDLLKETEAKKRKLQKVNQKKLRLFDEVRFLRKRYKSLMKNPSQQNQCLLLKRQGLLVESSSRANPSRRVLNHAIPEETPSTSIDASVDLNHHSLQSEEETEDHLMLRESSKDDSYSNRYREEEETTLVCRDLGDTSSSQAGKRKISWQDQYALRV
ncbi:hypothetical protein LUZ61_008459 [Rhynchospora tenuis]|uniref:Uncharacterized protein n=1 Tax=Rhynchospora tenuis TaxID=198213 RepID=A0AAD6EXJ6_9POAL|nr:hypothetical protein LUZ61_008459 [Rhynchospora tenuis]